MLVLAQACFSSLHAHASGRMPATEYNEADGSARELIVKPQRACPERSRMRAKPRHPRLTSSAKILSFGIALPESN